jgi:hypothetical protein
VVAEFLCPKNYPIGTKRICVDTNYFGQPGDELVSD